MQTLRSLSVHAPPMPCGLQGILCGSCTQLRGCPTLRGLGITLPTLPDWLKDWRIWAAVIAVLLLVGGVFGGKAARKRRRRKLAAARLRYMQERLG